MKKINVVVLVAMFFALSYLDVAAAGDEILSPHKASYRVTYDPITLPKDETMGLLGASYLLEKDNWYRGLGTYSAVTGQRGGFFTIGLELGRYFEVNSNWRVNGGLFVGGGGGGAAPQGGGLMLRQFLATEYQHRNQAYSLGLSAIQFPNGDITSQQLTVGYSWSFDTLFVPSSFPLQGLEERLSEISRDGYRPGIKKYRLLSHVKFYQPSSNVVSTEGYEQNATMRVFGGELQYQNTDSLYTGFATYGGNGGGIDGFAQLGVFGGLEANLLSSLTATSELHLAAAGGGRVDTGGGLLLGAELGLRWGISRSLFVASEIGYLSALDGSFSATSLGASLGYNYNQLGLGEGAFRLPAIPHYIKQNWQFRTLHQSYLPTDRSYKKNQSIADKRRVDLVGMALDLYFTPNLYLSGQAMGAYAGGAGGYASGMFALGFRQPVFNTFSVGAEFAVGAAGGGGLAVGEGLVTHALLNGEYQYNERYSLGLSLGKFESQDSDYQVDLLQFSVGYRFIDVLVR